jgi:hypothetical protein
VTIFASGFGFHETPRFFVFSQEYSIAIFGPFDNPCLHVGVVADSVRSRVPLGNRRRARAITSGILGIYRFNMTINEACLLYMASVCLVVAWPVKIKPCGKAIILKNCMTFGDLIIGYDE